MKILQIAKANKKNYLKKEVIEEIIVPILCKVKCRHKIVFFLCKIRCLNILLEIFFFDDETTDEVFCSKTKI